MAALGARSRLASSRPGLEIRPSFRNARRASVMEISSLSWIAGGGWAALRKNRSLGRLWTLLYQHVCRRRARPGIQTRRCIPLRSSALSCRRSTSGPISQSSSSASRTFPWTAIGKSFSSTTILPTELPQWRASSAKPIAGCAASGALAVAASREHAWREYSRVQARYVAVMDADLQHDEGVLLPMLAALRAGDTDLVVASRYLDGGSAAGLSKQRSLVSRWSNSLVHLLLGIDLTDPMSGYFMIRRDAVEAIAPSLSSQGFKILLDIMVTSRGRLRTVELPSAFRERQRGESKLDSKIALDFVALVTAKFINDAISPRFLSFCLVGLTGLGIHLALLSTLLAVVSFSAAQALATVGAITWNFVLNNLFTYYDQRLTGWHFVSGLIRFQLICAIGAVSNVGIATWMYDYHTTWWIAGLGGALIGSVWNFAVSAAFVWRQH